MMGHKGLLLLATIAFLSFCTLELRSAFAQSAFAQEDIQTSDTQVIENTVTQNTVTQNTVTQNTVVGENGLIAVLPTEATESSSTGLIGVIPNGIVRGNESGEEFQGIIAVVPPDVVSPPDVVPPTDVLPSNLIDTNPPIMTEGNSPIESSVLDKPVHTIIQTTITDEANIDTLQGSDTAKLDTQLTAPLTTENLIETEENIVSGEFEESSNFAQTEDHLEIQLETNENSSLKQVVIEVEESADSNPSEAVFDVNAIAIDDQLSIPQEQEVIAEDVEVVEEIEVSPEETVVSDSQEIIAAPVLDDEVIDSVSTTEKEEVIEEVEVDLREFAVGTGFMGGLELNSSTQNVLATDLSEAVYHTYELDVPEGQGTLTIMADGQGSNVDLAIKAMSEITDYTDVDYLDDSDASSASYSYQSPPSGPIYIEVMNYTEEPVAYTLTISDEPSDVANNHDDEIVNAQPSIQPLDTGHFYDLSLNSVLSRDIAAKEPSATLVYHSYELALPKGLASVEVLLDGQGHDVDMAVRLDQPITRLDEVDFIDNSSSAVASYQLQTIKDTVLYIDVMNYMQEAAHYELQVIAEAPTTENTTPNITSDRLYAPNVDASLQSDVKQKVTNLSTGKRHQGTITTAVSSDSAQNHNFLIRVPEGTKRFVATLNSDHDLDIALKYASPIESYALKKQGGDWDYLDMSPANNSRIQVDAPEAGFWYIDVIQANNLQEAAPYTLQVYYP